MNLEVDSKGEMMHIIPPPPLIPNQYSLRIRVHPFQLPIINTTLLKSTFINRCLFQFEFA